MAMELISGNVLTIVLILAIGGYIWLWLVNMKTAANFTMAVVSGIARVIVFIMVGLFKGMYAIFNGISSLIFKRRR